MKIRYLWAVALSLTCIAAPMAAQDNAEENPLYVLVQLSYGKLKAFEFDHIKKMTFQNNKLVIEMDDGSETKEYCAYLQMFDFSYDKTGAVAGVTPDDGDSAFSYSPTSATLSFSGNPGSKLVITNMAGQIMLTHDTDTDSVTIDISVLPSGMYIASCGGKSFKFKK